MLNEEPNLRELVGRVARSMQSAGLTWELVAVLDGCTDDSLGVLLELMKTHDELVVVELAHTVGQHAAIGVGFSIAVAPNMVTIDADLQNPPEAIPDIVERLKGAAAVGTVRKGRKDPFLRGMASRVFRATLAAVGIRHSMTDPGCMLRGWRKEIVSRFLKTGDPAIYVPTQLNRLSPTYVEFETEHDARHGGTSRYNALRLARLFGRTVAAQLSPRLVRQPKPRISAVFGGRQ